MQRKPVPNSHPRFLLLHTQSCHPAMELEPRGPDAGRGGRSQSVCIPALSGETGCTASWTASKHNDAAPALVSHASRFLISTDEM